MGKRYICLLLILGFLLFGCVADKTGGGHVVVNVYYDHPDGPNTMLKDINLKLSQRKMMKYRSLGEKTTGEEGVSFVGLEKGKYKLEVSDLGETGSLRFPDKEIFFRSPEKKNIEVPMHHKLFGRVYLKDTDGEEVFQDKDDKTTVTIEFTREGDNADDSDNTDAINTIFMTKKTAERYGLGYFGISYHSNDESPIEPNSIYNAGFGLGNYLNTDVSFETDENGDAEFKKVILYYNNPIDINPEDTEGGSGDPIPPG